jgi:outer membrane murein-binding lipoprotein Lpp
VRWIGAAALAAAAAAATLLAGCASREEHVADAATRAIYNDDVDALTSQFSPDLRAQVTRAQLGALSDIMHKDGDYSSLRETGTEPDGAYDFLATFGSSSMVVKMKLDDQGRISGYRVIPQPEQ